MIHLGAGVSQSDISEVFSHNQHSVFFYACKKKQKTNC